MQVFLTPDLKKVESLFKESVSEVQFYRTSFMLILFSKKYQKMMVALKHSMSAGLNQSKRWCNRHCKLLKLKKTWPVLKVCLGSLSISSNVIRHLIELVSHFQCIILIFWSWIERSAVNGLFLTSILTSIDQMLSKHLKQLDFVCVQVLNNCLNINRY